MIKGLTEEDQRKVDYLLVVIKRTKAGQSLIDEIERGKHDVFVQIVTKNEMTHRGGLTVPVDKDGKRVKGAMADTRNPSKGTPALAIVPLTSINYPTNGGAKAQSSLDQVFFHELCHARDMIYGTNTSDTTDIDGKPLDFSKVMSGGAAMEAANGEYRTIRRENDYLGETNRPKRVGY